MVGDAHPTWLQSSEIRVRVITVGAKIFHAYARNDGIS